MFLLWNLAPANPLRLRHVADAGTNRDQRPATLRLVSRSFGLRHDVASIGSGVLAIPEGYIPESTAWVRAVPPSRRTSSATAFFLH